MAMGLVSVAATVCATLATQDLIALCLTPPTLTSSRRTLKVHQHADAHKIHQEVDKLLKIYMHLMYYLSS